MLSTREAYGKALEKLGEEFDFYVMDADLSKATKTDNFAAKYPKRFFNMGISEGDMMSTAAGMASCGNTVFASTFAVFATGRAFEQIRNSIAYTKLNVKIAASHGGVLIGEDGGSHQAVEDVALMRALPNMTVLCPCDELSTFEAVKAAILHEGPVYLRFGRFPCPAVYTETPSISIGGGNIVASGNDIAILAMGDMVSASLAARELLAKEGISAAVADLYSVKPLNRELVISLAKQCGKIVTVEDHNIIGGLGSAVAEVLAETGVATMARVGVPDVFGRSGKPGQLAEYFGLTGEAIAKSCKKMLAEKR